MKLGRLCFFVVQRGVRGLMLDMYDFRNDIWLCHSFAGICQNFTAFVSALLLFSPPPSMASSEQSEF